MHFKASTVVALAFASQAFAHCVITSITGANGVVMPGLSVIDGTPRDCPTARCGAQSDTAVIRNNGLGRTSGGGPVNAAAAVANFMGTGAAAKKVRRGRITKKSVKKPRQLLNRLGGLLGGAGGGAGRGAAGGTAVGTPTPPGTVEEGVASSAGEGASTGLPTVGADGVISMTMHQINQDGAGPMTASIDPTSGGTSEAAFQPAAMIADVPGIAAGFSTATNMDFPITVQMPAGMVCSGTVAGVQNVCVVRVRNTTPAGPFGGSAVFTQETAAGAATARNATAARRDIPVGFYA